MSPDKSTPNHRETLYGAYGFNHSQGRKKGKVRLTLERQNSLPLLAGIDVGSTTTKIVVLDGQSQEMLYYNYERHHASQIKSVAHALQLTKEHFAKNRYMRLKLLPVFTGSGAKTLADRLKRPYVQEVIANSIAIRKLYSKVNTAIELGGQDAKVLFFNGTDQNSSCCVTDMRMNGNCAGGTGAFLDEVATILNIPVEQFDTLARQGETVYDISGRCGVFAKTDIQPLLNQGASKKDLALSALHAVAKQTIGGLAQGIEIKGPVLFEGGPLTFIPTLIQVFAKRLKLSSESVLVPERPEIMVAYGAALALNELFSDNQGVDLDVLVLLLESIQEKSADEGVTLSFFSNDEDKQAFLQRHSMLSEHYVPVSGSQINAYLGIDSGSTTTKFALINENENLVDSFYAPNAGEPLEVARQALLSIRDRWRSAGITLNILAACVTGYGEELFHRAFSTEYHVVETVAHAHAAVKYVPNATFLLDIGGQDMKAIWLDRGVVTNIVVNEACSSGCGSFLENFAVSLHIPVEKIAETAFPASSPAVLGSRCTVFMNSSIVTAQRNGKQADDIMAGLCRSIIENVFTKVIRVSNLNSLGNQVVVQGGTFLNNAVLRALEQYLGHEVIRAPYPGIMGALGAALLAKKNKQNRFCARKNYLEVLSAWMHWRHFLTPKPKWTSAHFVPITANARLSAFLTGKCGRPTIAVSAVRC